MGLFLGINLDNTSNRKVRYKIDEGRSEKEFYNGISLILLKSTLSILQSDFFREGKSAFFDAFNLEKIKS